MLILVRAITYATIFISLVLIYLPSQLLERSGILRPAVISLQQVIGMFIGSFGAVLAVWCVFTFALLGKGTPAPFDPPRKLVIQGPYRFTRNPMYLGAGFALTGVSILYESWPLLIYTGIFLLAAHLFVIWYEEPTLRRTFGEGYDIYTLKVKRWWLWF
jgi:protein-S-isoprenylcysteine O-methyltransferase Ste14